MAFDTYANLQTEVANYLHRSDLTAKIPGFITLAEAEMKRLLRVWHMEETSSLSITASSDEVALPTRTREVMSVKLTGTNERELLKLPLPALNRMYAQAEAGIVKHYALREDELVLGPTPSESGTLEVKLRRTAEPLSGSNGSNFILENYPDLYLYGAAKHGFLYMRHPERASAANQAFLSGIEEANRESRKKKASGTPWGALRMGARRIV